MQPTITYLHLHGKEELLSFKEKILSLFADCFMRDLDPKLWEWLYLQNPLGDPIINLAFLNNELIGHYAFIPIKTNQYRIFLSATTMVSKSARKHNVFYDLALRSYDFAKSYCDLIIGFPNKNASLVHQALLHWKLQDTFIIKTKSYTFGKQHTNNLIDLDLQNQTFLQWRLSKPNTSYIIQDQNLILKQYGDSIDVVYSGEVEHLEESHLPYNILTQDVSLKSQKIIDYPFAYKILNPAMTIPPPPTQGRAPSFRRVLNQTFFIKQENRSQDWGLNDL